MLAVDGKIISEELKVQLSNLEKTLTTINNGYNTLLKRETKTYNGIKSGKAKIENAKTVFVFGVKFPNNA